MSLSKQTNENFEKETTNLKAGGELRSNETKTVKETIEVTIPVSVEPEKKFVEQKNEKLEKIQEKSANVEQNLLKMEESNAKAAILTSEK